MAVDVRQTLLHDAEQSCLDLRGKTADVLKRIIEGEASEVVDRALADLLGLEGDVDGDKDV